jgi:hypothetical protein
MMTLAARAGGKPPDRLAVPPSGFFVLIRDSGKRKLDHCEPG